MCVLGLAVFAEAATVRVPLVIDRPAHVPDCRWPLTVGVPFPQGLVREVDGLCVQDDAGTAVACQLAVTARWRDGSVRWARVDFQADTKRSYSVVTGARPKADDDIRVENAGDAVTVHTGGATYRFAPGGGCFDMIQYNGRTLVRGAKDAFFAVDQNNRRAVLRAGSISVELNGPRHSVVRVEGEYRGADGKRVAEAVIYYHFHAGLPWVRVSHKFIITENSNELWFKDLGMRIPLQPGGTATGLFNHDHNDVTATTSVPLAGGAAFMAQHDRPHFASETSKFTIEAAGKVISTRDIGGDWADVSWKAGGLTVQLPALAEMFPKAIVAAQDRLVVKFWAGEETGKTLDFRTESLMRDYYGNDWIPADHPVAKAPNNARGSARTHDIWLYPHGVERDFVPAATSRPIYAMPDPAWTAASQVMGPLHPYDPQRFGDVEAVIEDYFNRAVLAGDRIFPAAGYLHYGCYPYSAQPWEMKNGRWYPVIHRLSRSLEYNLKRHAWILTARSAARKYHDYAKRYTRFMYDLGFSSRTPDGYKYVLRGGMYQGNPFDSPIVWADLGSHVAFASSEDVIQFVYDYHLTGDYHSRDMVRWWKESMVSYLNYDIPTVLRAWFPPIVFLRVLGSAYELEQDPELYEFGHKLLEVFVDPKNEVGLSAVKQNMGKAGDTFSVFYYYWVSTGDELALVPLLKRAEFDYRWARFGFRARSSDIPFAYGVASDQPDGERYVEYLRDHLHTVGSAGPVLDRLGLKFEDLNQKTDVPWGQTVMTESGPILNGLPVAMAAVAEATTPRRALPIAQKFLPGARTHLLFRKPAGAQVDMDVFVHNWGDRVVNPRLIGPGGAAATLTVVEKHQHREFGPPPEFYSWAYSPWFLTYETHLAYRLRVPADLPAGDYELDLGDHITFTVKDASIDQFVQVAPDGIGIDHDRDYFFSLPAGITTVQLFAHRKIHIARPDGTEVELRPVGEGLYEFDVAGAKGVWHLRTGTDKMVEEGGNVQTFVRFINVPLVLAMGDAGRLFDVAANRYPSLVPADLPAVSEESPFVPGMSARFGQAAALFQQFAAAPIPRDGSADFMRKQGTVEFWFRPLWSATDLAMPNADRSTQRGHFMVFDPVSFSCFIDPHEIGRSGMYNTCRMDVWIEGLGEHPVRFHFRKGEWYHIATTWRANGEDSEIRVFINGRRKALYHYRSVDQKVTPDKLIAPGATAMVGSAHFYNRGSRGEVIDEFRVSTVERYRDDFEPPAAPFSPDDKTYLLMHFDGDLSAVVAGKKVEAELRRGTRMK